MKSIMQQIFGITLPEEKPVWRYITPEFAICKKCNSLLDTEQLVDDDGDDMDTLYIEPCRNCCKGQ